MTDYCTPADLYSYGVPRGGLPNPGRLAGAVSTSDDTIELDGHGFTTGDPVMFRADSGSTLPSPLSASTQYYAIATSESLFQVATSPSGSAVNLTTAGSGVVVLSPAPTSAAITWASSVIDDMLPAHVVPLESPFPPIVVATCAELAAGKLLALRGALTTSLGLIVQSAQKRLERWSRGVPIRGTNAPKSAALSSSSSTPYRDFAGWSRYGGL